MFAARTSSHVDVAVVGAGITGLSIAWHGVQRGLSVAVIDGRGIGSGASAVQPGGIRQQWGTRLSCLMAREAYTFYGDIGERLAPAVDPTFSACGYLFVAHAQDTLARQSEHVALQNELGIPSKLLSAADVGELLEGLNADGIAGGVYCERDGYFDRPQAVVAAFAEAAWREGASFVDRHARALVADGAGWRLELVDGEPLVAQQVVAAASYETAELVAPLGLSLPIAKEARYLFYSDPIRERLLEPLVVAVDRHFAAKHLADGSVLASDLAAGSDGRGGKEAWHRHVRRTITELLPILEYVSFPVLVEGFYDVTPDRQPILGRVEGLEGLWIAAGLNGRGLMMAPSVGRLIADGLAGRAVDISMTALEPGRFVRPPDRDEPFVEEQQVI